MKWLCARCLSANNNAAGPVVYAILGEDREPLHRGPEILVAAYEEGKLLTVGDFGILPMDAITIIGGTALCVRHYEYGVPYRPAPPPGSWGYVR